MIDKFNIEQSIDRLKEDNEEIIKKCRKQAESIESEKKRNIFINQEVEKLSKHIRDLELQLDRERATSLELSQANQVLGFKILETR